MTDKSEPTAETLFQFQAPTRSYEDEQRAVLQNLARLREERRIREAAQQSEFKYRYQGKRR